jgi:phosphatidylglycerol---prolipoprotein diacylglyceryl transferase
MYANLYYVFKDWFGVEWKALSILNTFGLMVALSFIAAAIIFSKELVRREKLGLLFPKEEVITVGKPASITELIVNGIVGFIFGYKVFGLLFNRPADVNPQEYIFSSHGNILGGLALALGLAGLKWYETNKQKLKEPERRSIRIWPHDRVGEMAVMAGVFGILGAKLFDAFESWDRFIADPIGTIFSAGGLTFYGGLITAAIAIIWYAKKKGIKIMHLVDACAPGLILAYALGRIGCQVAGDGDWGVYNSAYVTDAAGVVRLAQPNEFNAALQKDSAYYVYGKLPQSNDYNGRKANSIAEVAHINYKAPSFLPTWMVAYTYPKNVNVDGVLIPNDNDEHNRALPLPVFPTPFYETVMGLVIFGFMWAIRKRITTPGVMFGIYLILNGVERFAIEKIRVNDTYNLFGFHPSQAQVIAVVLIIMGVALCVYQKMAAKKQG